MRFRARHALFALGLLLATAPALISPSAEAASIDPNTVGAWTLPVNLGRWLWQIDPQGSYAFHSEAADGVPPHSGTFAARDGVWTLQATNGYGDGGTYIFQAPDALVASGRLGTAAWHRLGEVANDPNTIGSWEVAVPGGRWVWIVATDGSYTFHSEAGDGVAAQMGMFAASGGYWWLLAANGYADGGTYNFQAADSLTTTGHLGTATWHHPASGKNAGDTANDANSDPCFLKAIQAWSQTGTAQDCR